MKAAILSILASSILALPAGAIESMPGSLNHVQQPAQSGTHQTRVGSVTFNQLYFRGNTYREIYRVGPDGDLELINRTLLSN